MPNDLNYLPIALNSINSMAQILGFNKQDISKIEVGAEEAIVNVITHAFEPGEETSFDVLLEPESRGLNIVIKEKGIPFDPKMVHEFKPEHLSDDMSVKGLGTFLMKQFMDKVSFHNLGKEGKETHLFKYLHNIPIDQQLSTREYALVEKEKHDERLPKGSVTYDVRRMKPEEAIDISKGAYSSYGYSYVLEHIYFPERVKEMNLNDELISFVAVTSYPEVIGHCALEIEETDPQTPQLGVAFTKPKYRGQGCLNKLANACLNDAIERSFYGIYARGVTTHPYSQKSLIKFGINDCSIFLSSGVTRKYKGMESHDQRESVVIHFRYMKEAPDIQIHPPVHHVKIISKIYKNIGGKPIIALLSEPEYDAYKSKIKIETDALNLVGRIRVLKQGRDVVPEVLKNLKSLCLDRMETIYLFLKLTEPMTSGICQSFENKGFFFSGIMPASENSDFLVLQYFNNQILDYSKIQVASEFGNELLKYIESKDPSKNAGKQ